MKIVPLAAASTRVRVKVKVRAIQVAHLWIAMRPVYPKPCITHILDIMQNMYYIKYSELSC